MIFTKRDENSIAEYYTTSNGEKTLTIRLSKLGGVTCCLTCISASCAHCAEFKRWKYKAPDPWDTNEGLTVEGPK